MKVLEKRLISLQMIITILRVRRIQLVLAVVWEQGDNTRCLYVGFYVGDSAEKKDNIRVDHLIFEE